MTRKEALSALKALSEPLGPLRTPEEAEASERAWAVGAGGGAIEPFLDLLASPPFRPADHAGYEFEVARALTLLASAHPTAFLDSASARIHDPRLRPTLIEVLGTLPRPESLALLEPLVRPEQDLSQEEVVRLACALGEIGGERALRLLEALRLHPVAALPRAAAEIETATRYAEGVTDGARRSRH